LRKKPERAPAVEAIRKGGIVHGASLVQFLLLSNQLSSDPVEPARLALLILTLAVRLFKSGATSRLRSVAACCSLVYKRKCKHGRAAQPLSLSVNGLGGHDLPIVFTAPDRYMRRRAWEVERTS
jgi:hypothetical protein